MYVQIKFSYLFFGQVSWDLSENFTNKISKSIYIYLQEKIQINSISTNDYRLEQGYNKLQNLVHIRFRKNIVSIFIHAFVSLKKFFPTRQFRKNVSYPTLSKKEPKNPRIDSPCKHSPSFFQFYTFFITFFIARNIFIIFY